MMDAQDLGASADGALRAQVKEAWQSFRGCGWDLAVLLSRIADYEIYRGWRSCRGGTFPSLIAWAAEDLELASDSTLGDLVAAGRFFRTRLDAGGRDRWRTVPVWKAAAILPLLPGRETEAFDLAASERTPAEIRRAVELSLTPVSIRRTG